MWSVNIEYEVWSIKCGVESVTSTCLECEVWSVKCGV